MLYTKDCLNELLIWKKNLLQVFCITEKEILVMVSVQSILLIPLRVKLRLQNMDVGGEVL